MPVKYIDSKNTNPLMDFDKPALSKKYLCADCAVKRIVAGQAFTRYKCAVCAEVGLHGNTAVPKVCRECAGEKGLCVRCSGLL